MHSDKLMIAAAGSGKTTYLVKHALQHPNEQILLTTYTQANEAGIRAKFIGERGGVPPNVTVQTWFSFLLQHGVRPYQGALNDVLFEREIRGMLLVNEKSGLKYRNGGHPVYFAEGTDFERHYFSPTMKIYSDKIAKFVCKANKASSGEVIRRLSKIYSTILVDEVQDLAGNDLELLKLLFDSSMHVLLVGDPRQVTYLTHIEATNAKYKGGKIVEYVESVKKESRPSIDATTLNISHRNGQKICSYSARLYPNFAPVCPCTCVGCSHGASGHTGVFLVVKGDVGEYLQKYNPVQLRWSSRTPVDDRFPAMNFGESKGLEFERVLIYPTDDMIKWMRNNASRLSDEARAKFYVGLTRAKFSVSIVLNFEDSETFEGVERYSARFATSQSSDSIY